MARLREVEPSREVRDGVPALLRDPLSPAWRDEDALVAAFGQELVTQAVLDRLRMGGSVRNTLTSQWAVANNLTTDYGVADWHALRSVLGKA